MKQFPVCLFLRLVIRLLTGQGIHPHEHGIPPTVPGPPPADLRIRPEEPDYGQAGVEASLVQGDADRRWHGSAADWATTAPEFATGVMSVDQVDV